MREIREEILTRLFAMQDPAYRAFQGKLLPTVPPERMIGVRTPALRQYARELAGRGDVVDFLSALPHRYFDENQLHAFILSLERDYDKTIAALNAFLPYVDNWATCDQLSPRAFCKRRAELRGEIAHYLASRHPYSVRFGVGLLMRHFLDEDFDPKYLAWVAALRSEDYYVNMGIAWYFATALAKQWDAALPYLEQRRLDPWTHNKAIQKARESNCVPEARKQYLRTLREERNADGRKR